VISLLSWPVRHSLFIITIVLGSSLILLIRAVRFPPESSLTRGQTNQIFTVSKNVWDVHDHGNNNCTSILTGTNFLEKDAGAIEWLVGQPLFAGHYIDFDIAGKRIGYGNLANPETGT
jgi:pepsin A